MSIDFFDAFHNWAINKFGDANVKINGQEICINSPFVKDNEPDFKYHCWCNPYKNAFNCWKSLEHGSLHRFVSEFEPCDLVDVDEILGNTNIVRGLEEKIKQFFSKKIPTTSNGNNMALPVEAVIFDNLPPIHKKRVEDYMVKRKLSPYGLFYCHTGRYRERIIIPYYGKNGDLIYFNGRDISVKQKGPRYLGPPKEIGVGKGDVLWMNMWPSAGKIYLCEGEFNAMSLCQSQLIAAACGGKNLSDRQLVMLNAFDVVFCFDNDKSGQEALHKFSEYKKSFHGGKSSTVGFVLPPKGFKDWNDFLIKIGPAALNYYIISKERQLNWDDFMRMRLSL